MAYARVYSTRFFAEQALTGSRTVVVPAGQLMVVRDLDVFQASSSGGGGLFLIGSAGQTIYAVNFGGGAFETAHWEGRQVLDAGETLTITTTGPLDVTVSGYLLAAA